MHINRDRQLDNRYKLNWDGTEHDINLFFGEKDLSHAQKLVEKYRQTHSASATDSPKTTTPASDFKLLGLQQR